MRSLVFDTDATATLVTVAAGQRFIFYGADLNATGLDAAVVQFIDGASLALSPVLENLIPGVIHTLPVLYEDGMPVPRAMGGKSQHGRINIVGGTTPKVRGTLYYDAQ